MTVNELIEELKLLPGNLPIYDWDNDEITYVKLRQKETIDFGKYHNCPFDLPERVELG